MKNFSNTLLSSRNQSKYGELAIADFNLAQQDGGLNIGNPEQFLQSQTTRNEASTKRQHEDIFKQKYLAKRATDGFGGQHEVRYNGEGGYDVGNNV